MIIGPTSSASFSFGVQPVGMKRAVIRPHAMNALILGMIMPARYPPNFWTRARALVPSRFLFAKAFGIAIT